MGWVYILHFDDAFSHAVHYTGSTTDIVRRMDEHANGRGARLTQVLCEEGLHWRLGGLYQVPLAALRDLEKLAKRRHGAGGLCQICGGIATLPGGERVDLANVPFPVDSRTLRG